MTKTPKPLYVEIASILNAIDNCRKNGNNEWLDKHETSLHTILGYLPSGSGIDAGIAIEREECKPNKLVFSFSFHHMDENGMYSGWTDHKLTVTPSLQFGVDLRITGRDKNQIKGYLYEIFRYALTAEVWQDSDSVWRCSLFEKICPVCQDADCQTKSHDCGK